MFIIAWFKVWKAEIIIFFTILHLNLFFLLFTFLLDYV